ncbi:MAG: DUF2142 domain-containing protein [Anaerolineae bacterium]|nr:DUF2142 domain-containing protein [Anaerolineae bacterium]
MAVQHLPTNPIRRSEIVTLALIVLAYLVVATLYAIKTPAWQVPDEPAHYNYVAQVAQNGCCPVLKPGDWDNDYLESIKAQRFSPTSVGTRLNTIQYEDHQPPLFYLLNAPFYTISGGNLTVQRLLSVVLGAGVVIVAWAVARVVFPAQPWLALATAAFVAFLPQHVAMMAGVENDSLAELIMGLMLLASVHYLASTRASLRWPTLILGVLTGAAFVTKLTIYFPVIAAVGLAILLRAYRERWSLPRLITVAAWAAVPALIIGGMWWARNITTYGDVSDFMAQKTHDAVVVGQLRASDYVAQHGGVGAWLRDGVQITFQSFWGQFGWMGVLMPPALYTLLLAFSLVIVVGAGIAWVRWQRKLSRGQREALLIGAAVVLLTLVEFVGYNLQFVQFQGRYLYPALIPIALFVVVGLAGWASLIAARWPVVKWATVIIPCLFAALDVYLLYRVIVPNLQ